MRTIISSLTLILLVHSFATFKADASEDVDRMKIINRELDCFSDAASRGKVDWNDVCVTSPVIDDILADSPSSSREEIIDKSMEQLAQEHRRVTQEMLQEPYDSEDNRDHATSVDEVYKQHDQYHADDKTLDDVIAANKSIGSQDLPDEANDESLSPDPRGLDKRPSYISPSAGPHRGLLARDSEKNQNTSEIGFEFNRYRYVEPVFDLVTQGNLFGLFANFTARPAKNEALWEEIINVYKADVRFNYGLVDYKSAPSGKLEDNQDWVVETKLMVGKDFMLSSDVRLTPYIGFGYRYLNDDSAGRATSTGAVGYERESRYYYVPMTVELTAQLTDSWLIAPSLEYDHLIQGEQLSYLSDVSPAYPDLRNKQRKGFGLRGSLKFIQTATALYFVIEPYIRYWHIEDSEEATVAGPVFIVSGLEPENKTLEYGIRLGVMF